MTGSVRKGEDHTLGTWALPSGYIRVLWLLAAQTDLENSSRLGVHEDRRERFRETKKGLRSQSQEGEEGKPSVTVLAPPPAEGISSLFEVSCRFAQDSVSTEKTGGCAEVAHLLHGEGRADLCPTRPCPMGLEAPQEGANQVRCQRKVSRGALSRPLKGLHPVGEPGPGSRALGR